MHSIAKSPEHVKNIRKRSQKPAYLICYDIRDSKRLKRVHYFISKRAIALQYSLFLVMDKPSANSLFKSLLDMIDPEDDLRMYTLSGQKALWKYGNRLTNSPEQKAQHNGMLSWVTSLFSGE